MSAKFQKGTAHFKAAQALIPWATQTNAKRRRAEWGEAMPLFIERAQGCHMWDLDGREFIDYRCSLGPIILGYRYPAVDEAVRRQMEKGVLFSMASPIELEVAQAFVATVPWVEQVRFMKTGADANTSCLRLARSYTGRDHILTSGYHGYHDWFAFDWPDPGVPEVLKTFVHEVDYGDIEAVERVFAEHGSQLAAAIVAPYEWNEEVGHDYLRRLRQKCDATGTLLIFDEVLTGFRMAPGGAQAYFGVTPDLAAYAKALANGYPVSAFAGKKIFMQTLEKTIITTTYAGETLSLAAAKATLDIMTREPVHEHIFQMGQHLQNGFAEIIRETGAPAHAAGLLPAPFIHFDLGDEAENLRWQDNLFSRLFARGIFANDRWFISYSHTPEDIDATLEQVRQAMREMV